METENELVNVLTDLAGMHENRIHEYEELMVKIKDSDKDLSREINNKIEESCQLESELEQEMSKLTDSPPSPPFTSNRLQRLWMEIRSLFTGNDKRSVLAYAGCVEHAMLRSYRHALESEATMGIDIRALINRHYLLLKSSYDKISAEADATQSHA